MQFKSSLSYKEAPQHPVCLCKPQEWAIVGVRKCLAKCLYIAVPQRVCLWEIVAIQWYLQGWRQWYGRYMAVPVFEGEKMVSLGF